jgi:hypothetical protein
MTRTVHSLIAGALMGFGMVPLARAGDSEVNRLALKGVQAVRVAVEMRERDEEWQGPTRGEVRADVEGRLRRAGISITTQPGAPYLYVNVEAVKHADSPIYGYIIDVELRQAARVVRNPSIVVYADTWSIHSIGTVEAAELSTHLRVKLHTHLDLFIDAYLAMNPRR